MGNNLAAVVAFATGASTRVAVTPEREMYERAVTRGDSRGQVCPSTGGAGFRACTWHGSDLSDQRAALRSGISARYGAAFGASSVMNNASLSKPRFGYCAMSGTG